MARGQRKTLEEKIQQKQEIINALAIRIKHEKDELEALFSQQRQNEIESLYNFVKTSNLSVYDAVEILQQYLTEQFSETA